MGGEQFCIVFSSKTATHILKKKAYDDCWFGKHEVCVTFASVYLHCDNFWWDVYVYLGVSLEYFHEAERKA